MNHSTLSRWGRGWLAGAGLACLGAGFFFVEGCTSATTVDLKSSLKNRSLFAKKGSATAPDVRIESAKPQLAAKNASGRVRVTDLDDETAARLAEKKAPPKTGGTKLASATARPPVKDPRVNLDLDDDRPDTVESRVTASKPGVKSATAARRSATTTNRPTKVAASDFDPDLDDATSDFDEPPVSPSRKSRTVGKTVAAAKRPAPVKGLAGKPKAKSFDPELDVDEPSMTQVVDEIDAPEEEAPVARRPTAQQKLADRTSTRKAGLGRNEATRAAIIKTSGSAHERRRADQLMQRAYAMYRSGYPEEALRLASVAVELEKSQQATYKRGEERPSDFITWLQSGDAANIPTAPVITPEPGLDGPSTEPAGDELEESDSGVEAVRRGRLGNQAGASGGPTILAKRKPVHEPVNTARSNAGLTLCPPDAPAFPAAATRDLCASANSGQLEVAPIPTPRIAEVSAVTVAPQLPTVDAQAVSGAAPPAASAAAPKTGETHLVMRPSAPVPPPVDDIREDAETVVETEISALSPVHSSQVTIVSMIGLIAGVAGMFGLSWWRIQESRHFATGK